MESKQIVKKSLVLAPPERVWAALTDADQFATWFGAEFDSPFVAGAHVVGRIIPTKVLPPVARRRKAYTGLPLELDVKRVEPPRLLCFRWSPFAFFNPDLRAAATSRVIVEIEPDATDETEDDDGHVTTPPAATPSRASCATRRARRRPTVGTRG